jgi:Zn-dependent protease
MRLSPIRIGSVMGVPVYVTPSWLIVSAFITVSYAGDVQRQVASVSAAGSYLIALLYALALAASVLLHEMGHTVVSRALGLPVRRIVLFLLGGISEIIGEPVRPRDDFAIAAAGPAVSFLLAVACWAVSFAVPAQSGAAFLIQLLLWSNLIIAIFNVLPGLPLDGGRIVQAVFWQVGSSRIRGVRAAAWSGRGLAILLAVGTVLATSTAPRGLYSPTADIIATSAGFAISAFIFVGAGQTLAQAELLAAAQSVTLEPLIRSAVYVPVGTPVAEAVRRAQQQSARAIVILDGQQRCHAIVDEAALNTVSQHRRPWLSSDDIARELLPGHILSDSLAGQDLFDAVAAHPSSEYLIIGADGLSRGVLATIDLRQKVTR